MLQGLEAADRHPELLARLDVVQGAGKQRIHHAQRFAAQQTDAEVGRLIEHLAAGAEPTQQRRRRHRHVAELHRGRALAVERAVVAHGQARGVGGHHEQADAVDVALAAGAAGRDDQRIGLGAVDHHGLGAVDAVALAVDSGQGLDVGQVVARVLFTQRARQFGAAFGHVLQQVILVAGQLEEICAPGGGEIRLDHQAAPQLLHHHQHVDGVAVEAALAGRHRQRGHAQLGQCLPRGV